MSTDATTPSRVGDEAIAARIQADEVAWCGKAIDEDDLAEFVANARDALTEDELLEYVAGTLDLAPSHQR